MRNGNHDTTHGNVMIFQYLDNGKWLTVSGWTINGERWGVSGERMSESAIRLPYLDKLQRIMIFSRLSEDLFVLLIWGRVSRCRRQSVNPSYHPATNLMFSDLNPPDGEVQTIRGFSAQNPIFRCVKNFMHLISSYLSLIISIYLYLSLIIRAPKGCRIFAMLTRNGTIIVGHKRLLR